MPIVRDGSVSPVRNHDRSPSPIHERGPKGKRFTANDFQKRALDKLLANPDQELIPQPRGPERDRAVKPPPDMVKNVQGSASAAGSGEFHVYKHARRREAERVKAMDARARDLEEQAEFRARQDARDAVADAKTAKNRAKRLKRKGGAKKNGADGGADDDEDGTEPKRKLANGGGLYVPPPIAAEEEEVGPTPVFEPQRVAEEARVTIHDDD